MGNLPTKKEFKTWRSPRRGKSNPEQMANPLWLWCIQSRQSAYCVNEKFDGPNVFSAGPCWCFDRLGQAQLSLPDGRDVFISGEHEDHYDPDFYIYNDVVVADGDDVAIFGYPESVFPPTDFQTATLVESSILLIGNLGYPEDRKFDQTQVLRLDTRSWSITSVPTDGELPGWIHRHSAKLSDGNDTIEISGGKRCRRDRTVENFHTYQLCLTTNRWSKTVERNWKAWILEREDGEPNRLWDIRTAAINRALGHSMQDHLQEAFSGIPEDVVASIAPKATGEQMEQIVGLYQSPFDHSQPHEDEEHFGRYRLRVGDTTIRIDENSYEVTVTCEGTLPDREMRELLRCFQDRLSAIEQTQFSVTPIIV